MIWLSKDELEEEGRPSRKDLAWAVAAIPLLLVQLSGWIYRFLASFGGRPLEISTIFGSGIYVKKSDPAWQYVGGLSLYMVLILFALALLWASSLQIQRWWYWRERA